MNEDIHCITSKGKGKKAMNEWENDDSDIPRALCRLCKKIRTILFPYLLANLFKQRYISFVKTTPMQI